MTRSLTLAAFCLLTSPLLAAEPEADSPLKPAVTQDVFVSGQEGYNTFRIPAIITTPKGTLLAFCEGRRNSRSNTGRIDLVLKRGIDGEKTPNHPVRHPLILQSQDKTHPKHPKNRNHSPRCGSPDSLHMYRITGSSNCPVSSQNCRQFAELRR